MIVKNVDFGNMTEREILDFQAILMYCLGNHFTKSAVDYIKKYLDVATIVDSKEDTCKYECSRPVSDGHKHATINPPHDRPKFQIEPEEE